MHVATFTEEGSWKAATALLSSLKELGITLIELMPVAEFPGRFGWGYDGVNLFAPTRLYGAPDEFRGFINEAHALGMGVILDVVYNHFGPDGNYLADFSEHYFTDKYKNEWGRALNFDGENNSPVREFFTTNAAYWIKEFHIDGLRLDATQQIFDSSVNHIIGVISRKVREAAEGRCAYLVAENESQHAEMAKGFEKGGYDLDALWNDDFHHSALVAVTGHREAYYTDYGGHPQEFISAAKYGYLYQGQWYSWQHQRRGRPAIDLEPSQFVNFMENHDQVANSLRGLRLNQIAGPGRLKAMTALLLLSPGTPMLFQGQEFWSSKPFLYFADHNPEIAAFVSNGRREFLSQFKSLANADTVPLLRDPHAFETFHACKLSVAERERNSGIVAFHRDLLRIRREHAAFTGPGRRCDGAVLGPEAFLLRFFADNDDDRLLLINLSCDLQLTIAPEPLLAPPFGCCWSVEWSSEDSKYGGGGSTPIECDGVWTLQGHAATLLAPVPVPS